MQVLTDKNVFVWLNKIGLSLGPEGAISFPGASDPEVYYLDPPSSRDAVTSWSLNLVEVLGSETPTEWLLWLTDFDIWNTEIEKIGWTLIESIAGSELSVNSSAFLFGANEIRTLKASLLVPILFTWDAYLIMGDGAVVVRIDHDDHGFISTTYKSVVEQIQGSQLSAWVRPLKSD